MPGQVSNERDLGSVGKSCLSERLRMNLLPRLAKIASVFGIVRLNTVLGGIWPGQLHYPDLELFVVQVRKRNGPSSGDWSPKFFQTIPVVLSEGHVAHE